MSLAQNTKYRRNGKWGYDVLNRFRAITIVRTEEIKGGGFKGVSFSLTRPRLPLNPPPFDRRFPLEIS